MICKHASEDTCKNCKWWGVGWSRSKIKRTCEDWGYKLDDVCTEFEVRRTDPPNYVVRVPSLGPEKAKYKDLSDGWKASQKWMKEQGFVEHEGAWLNFYWERDEAGPHLKLMNKLPWVRNTVGTVTVAAINNVKHIWNQLPTISQKWLDRKMLLSKVKPVVTALAELGHMVAAHRLAEVAFIPHGFVTAYAKPTQASKAKANRLAVAKLINLATRLTNG